MNWNLLSTTTVALVLRYCATNKLSVNLKKTNYMLILSAKKTVHININNIERKSFVKYLRIYIDEHLNWEPQIQHVNNKLAKNIDVLYKIRKYVDLNVLKQLYYTLVYPYLNHGIMSWGSVCRTRLTRVLTKQNQCVWCMFFAHRTESAKIYNALLEILELNNIYKLSIALFVHKIQNDKKGIAAIFSDALTPASETIVITPGMHGVKTSTE